MVVGQRARRTATAFAASFVALTVMLVTLSGSAAASQKSDTALANKAALQLSDFPSGWREQPATVTLDEQITLEGAIPDCAHEMARLKTAYMNTPHSDANRPGFANGSGAGQYAASTVS